MATATAKYTPKAGELVRCYLPGRKQSRIYSVQAIAKNDVTLQLAWAEKGKPFPVLGVSKEFKVSDLKELRPFEAAKAEAEVEETEAK
jgi:hypothetical protein